MEDLRDDEIIRQPICLNCTFDCAECVFRTLTWAGKRSDNKKDQKSDCNDEVFDV